MNFVEKLTARKNKKIAELEAENQKLREELDRERKDRDSATRAFAGNVLARDTKIMALKAQRDILLRAGFELLSTVIEAMAQYPDAFDEHDLRWVAAGQKLFSNPPAEKGTDE